METLTWRVGDPLPLYRPVTSVCIDIRRHARVQIAVAIPEGVAVTDVDRHVIIGWQWWPDPDQTQA